MIWTQPKLFRPDQNNLNQSKKIWTVQNHFGPIEGQELGSNLRHFQTNSIDPCSCPFGILFWDDIMILCYEN